MAKRLTEAQRLARKVVRKAAAQIIRELDASAWRKDCVAFRADFHLDCIKYSEWELYGQPALMETSYPIYRHVR